MRKQIFYAICIVSDNEGGGSVIGRFNSIEERDQWIKDLEEKPRNKAYACSCKLAKQWPYSSGFPVTEHDYRAK